MVKTLYDSTNVSHSGCPHTESSDEPEGDPDQRRIDALLKELGTPTAPFRMRLENGRIPLNELAAHGYETLAFPTLFPFGQGYFSQERAHTIGKPRYLSSCTSLSAEPSIARLLAAADLFVVDPLLPPRTTTGTAPRTRASQTRNVSRPKPRGHATNLACSIDA